MPRPALHNQAEEKWFKCQNIPGGGGSNSLLLLLCLLAFRSSIATAKGKNKYRFILNLWRECGKTVRKPYKQTELQNSSSLQCLPLIPDPTLHRQSRQAVLLQGLRWDLPPRRIEWDSVLLPSRTGKIQIHTALFFFSVSIVDIILLKITFYEISPVFKQSHSSNS